MSTIANELRELRADVLDGLSPADTLMRFNRAIRRAEAVDRAISDARIALIGVDTALSELGETSNDGGQQAQGVQADPASVSARS